MMNKPVEVICEYCSDTLSEYYCEQCETWYCGDCDKMEHTDERSFHKRIPKAEIPDSFFRRLQEGISSESVIDADANKVTVPEPIAVPASTNFIAPTNDPRSITALTSPPATTPASPTTASSPSSSPTLFTFTNSSSANPLVTSSPPSLLTASSFSSSAISVNQPPLSNSAADTTSKRNEPQTTAKSATAKRAAPRAEGSKKKKTQAHALPQKVRKPNEFPYSETEGVQQTILKLKDAITKHISKIESEERDHQQKFEADIARVQEQLQECTKCFKEQVHGKFLQEKQALRALLYKIDAMEAVGPEGGAGASARLGQISAEYKDTIRKSNIREHFAYNGTELITTLLQELSPTGSSKSGAAGSSSSSSSSSLSVPFSSSPPPSVVVDDVGGWAVKYPGSWKNGPRYALDSNAVVATCMSESRWDTVILGSTQLGSNAPTWWSVKFCVLQSPYGAFVGVAPRSINPHMYEAQTRCGWYISTQGTLLWSGPPHQCRGAKSANPRTLAQGSIIRLRVDTTARNGKMSFSVSKDSWVDAYDRIPLDEPLFPAVLLSANGDSVGLE